MIGLGYQNPGAAISNDLKEFDAKLRAAKQARQRDDPEHSQDNSSSGLRYGMEFVGGVLAGALLGWFIDQLFHTTPFGLIIFMLLGFASGLLSAIRSAKKAEQDAEAHGNNSGNSADGSN